MFPQDLGLGLDQGELGCEASSVSVGASPPGPAGVSEASAQPQVSPAYRPLAACTHKLAIALSLPEWEVPPGIL